MPIKKQISINSAGAFALMFFQWLISVLLVRMGGFADAGVFSLAMSVSNVFGAVAGFGLRTYQISDAGNEFTQNQYLYGRITTILLSFAVSILYLICDNVYSPQGKWAIFFYVCFVNCYNLADIMYGTMQLNGKLELAGYSCILKSAICLAASITTYYFSHDLVASIAVMVAGTALVTVFYDIRNYRAVGVGPGGRGDLSAVKKLLLRCVPLMVSALLPLVTVAIPRRALAGQMGEEYLGYYASLFAPTAVITTMAPAALTGFIPRFAGIWQKNDKKAFLRQTGMCALGIVGFTGLVAVAALTVGKPAVRLIFGEEIMPYYDLLYVAIAVSGMNALNMLGDNLLVCMRRTKTVPLIAAIDLITVTALSGHFIRTFGIYGTAWVMLAGYAVHVLLLTATICLAYRKHFTKAPGGH